MNKNSMMLLLLGVGGLVWYTSQSQASTPTSPTGTTGGGSTPPPPSTQTPIGTGTQALPPASVPTTPGYTGPSLAQIYQTLVAALLQGRLDGDTDVECAGGMSGLGLPSHPDQGIPIAVAGGVAPRVMPPTNQPATTPATCSAPLATPDVWSWYLMNKAGIPGVPGSNVAFAGQDLSVKIDGPTYWQAVAPFLQKAIPGLQGIAPMRLQRVVPVPRSYYYGGWGK